MKKKSLIWMLILIVCLFVATTKNAFTEDITDLATFKISLVDFSNKKFILTQPKITNGLSGDLFAYSNLSSGEASLTELLNFSWEFNGVFYRTSVPVSICEFHETKDNPPGDLFSVKFNTKNLDSIDPETERLLADLIKLKEVAPQSFLRTMLNRGNVDKITVYLSSETRAKLGI